MSVLPTMVVHGGAGTYALVCDGVKVENIEAGVKEAARVGYAVLSCGGTALEAVEAAAVSLEDNPIFNAGRGSALTIDGNVEMDACIQDGRTLRGGGVACIEHVKNPIKVAKLVMNKSEHVLFVGRGAEKFAKENGAQMCSTEELVTPKSKNRLNNYKSYQHSVQVDFKHKESEEDCHDTVGAVAVDTEGHVAYATTTGGICGKMPGRCGDSAIIGCGGLADDRICAVSTTGHGEAFIKTNAAKQMSFFVQQGSSIQEAVEKGLALVREDVDGCGGAIAVTPKGDVGVSFNTTGMAWAKAADGTLSYGIFTSEVKRDPLLT